MNNGIRTRAFSPVMTQNGQVTYTVRQNARLNQPSGALKSNIPRMPQNKGTNAPTAKPTSTVLVDQFFRVDIV